MIEVTCRHKIDPSGLRANDGRDELRLAVRHKVERHERRCKYKRKLSPTRERKPKKKHIYRRRMPLISHPFARRCPSRRVDPTSVPPATSQTQAVVTTLRIVSTKNTRRRLLGLYEWRKRKVDWMGSICKYKGSRASVDSIPSDQEIKRTKKRG